MQLIKFNIYNLNKKHLSAKVDFKKPSYDNIRQKVEVFPLKLGRQDVGYPHFCTGYPNKHSEGRKNRDIALEREK